jgi:site-specific recombinase XerD
VAAVIKKLADEPELADLDPETLEKVARLALIDAMKEKVKAAAKLEKIPYAKERDTFISRASRTGSERTKKLYAAALARLEAWCERRGVIPLELSPMTADDWIEAEKAEGRASATVRLDVAACSAFWTWMERRHPELKNPFRGSRARPPKKAARKLAVPSDDEIRILQDAAKPELRAAISVMAYAGLRVGGLSGLSITGAKWTTLTKGKEQSGKMPDAVREAIMKAGLTLRSPFKDSTADSIAKAFEYLAKKLHAAGQIKARYSVHDLRHRFAARTYMETGKDIYATKQALGHASIGTTETYLRSLGVTDE